MNTKLVTIKTLKSFIRNKQGFTLMELLVVIGILGVLAAALIATLDPYEQLKKGHDTRRKGDLVQTQHALELYYQDNGTYPASNQNYQISSVAWGGSWQPYITTLPSDPTVSQKYVYYSPPLANGQTYYIYASLERGTKDQQACQSGGMGICASLRTNNIAPNTCGGLGCNFGISSTNVLP